MKAVVLAAGRGTRLRPLTDDRPKGMVEIEGKPILTRCFETLAAIDPEEIVVVVGYRREAIVDHYGDAFRGTDLRYVHQAERKGLAHALLQARDHLDDDFVVVNGDNVFGFGLDRVVERHATRDPAATLLVDEVDDETARTVGVCEFDADGNLVGLVEKPDDPPSNCVVRGCYCFSPAILPACELVRPSERGEYELTDAVDLLAYAGHRVETVRPDGWLVNVNTEADLERVASLLAGPD